MASVSLFRKLAGERIMWLGCFAALLFGAGTMLFISLFIIVEAYPALVTDGKLIGYLFLDPWAPLADPPKFGIMHAWVSTVMVTAISLALATPFGFGIGIFVSEIAPRIMRVMMRPCIDLLAGIPSVVYGFFGYVTLMPWFENHFHMATGESILVAALILSVMVLPYVASTSAEAFSTVPPDLKHAALAHGVTRWHAIRRIVVPCAAPGMFAGVVLGVARAIGETLAVLMLTGNSVAVPTSVFDRGQPLTALIATELGEAGVGSEKYHALFAAGLVLMIVIIIINVGIWALKSRLIRSVK
jgi:phosphate ABC transporter permease protein PstC